MRQNQYGQGGVYRASPITLADGTPAAPTLNENGDLVVDASITLTQVTVGDAATGTDDGTVTMNIRDDATTTVTESEGEYTPGRANARGAMWVALETGLNNADDNILVYGNTVKDGSGTSYAILLDANGRPQVDVVSALPAGTNAIGKLAANSGVDIGDVDVTSVANASLNGPAEPTIDSYTQASISASADTANQSLIAAPGASKQIWVYGINFTVGTGDGSASFQDEDDTAISGVMPFAQNGGMVVSPSGNFAMPFWKVATNKALEVDTVTCDIKGSIQYAIVSV